MRDLPPSGPWRSRPVFISSTFKDMHAERDWLRARVFPRLEEELAQRRCHLEMIDLRLGVETARAESEEARELLVLKVCLDEIRRSRPFLLVLLGDRYGWIPAEDRIVSAAQEQGLLIAPEGKSVTAVEIEFGILKDDPAQIRRSLFFFRRPLPFERMPEDRRALYSDAFSPDAHVRAGHSRLAALKDRLRNDPELGPSVFDYELGWDPAAGKATGLAAFGELVREKLWALLDEETRSLAARPAPTPEDQERAALAEFIEQRSRVFVGREDVMRRVLNTARRRAPEGPVTGTTWGAYVVGPPGSGKSAVFAHAFRELERGDRRTLLLANAAGGTQYGSSVDAMLRRWTGELAATAGVPHPLSGKATANEIEMGFYDLLRSYASERHPVVILIDALDRFEPTWRGQHLGWLRVPGWPPHARIIATGLPCAAGEVFAGIPGIERIEIPPLAAADAAELGELIWRRYHREINPRVLRILMEKKTPGDPPAWQNPLWLTLALEQVNLLDAGDFARAEREVAGTRVELMKVLLYDAAMRIPADIDGLFGWLLNQNEKAFGAPHARGFAAALALSRSGWREIDLIQLVPRLGRMLFPDAAPEPLDDLGLAALRRGFRAHIIRRGENGQIDFAHAQTRRGMLARCAPSAEVRRALHAAIGDYLMTLPPDDPLIDLELMGQLIGERNALRTARYYAAVAEPGEVTPGRESATSTLAAWIAEGQGRGETNVDLEWIVSWPEAPGLTPEEVCRLAHKFQRVLCPRMEGPGGVGMQLALLDSLELPLRRLVKIDPANPGWQHCLATNHMLIGDVKLSKGDLPGALEAYRRYQAAMQRLAQSEPSNAGWQSDLARSHRKIGEVLLDQGDRDGALKACRESLAVAEPLAGSHPFDAGLQRDLLASHRQVGAVLLAKGDVREALQACAEHLALARRFAQSDPANPLWQGEVQVGLRGMGDVLLAQGDSRGAAHAYRESQDVGRRLAQSDPSNVLWQKELSMGQRGEGAALLAAGDLTGALGAFRESLATAVRAAVDPSDARWQRYLGRAHYLLGMVLEKRSDLEGAFEAYRAHQEATRSLVALDRFNLDWRRELAEAGNLVDRIFEDMFSLAVISLSQLAPAMSLDEIERRTKSYLDDVRWEYYFFMHAWWQTHYSQMAGNDARQLWRGVYESLSGIPLEEVERWAAAEPSVKLWQCYLFLRTWREAYLAERSGDRAKAHGLWGRASELLSALKKQGIVGDAGDKHFRLTREMAGN